MWKNNCEHAFGLKCVQLYSGASLCQMHGACRKRRANLPAEDIIASEMRLLDAKNAGVVLVENKLLVKEDLGEIVYR